MAASSGESEAPVILIEDLAGGGFTPDGKFIVFEFKRMVGDMPALQMPYNVAYRLILAAQQFTTEATAIR